MSKVRLTGATSGYTELAAAATAGNNEIKLPASNGAANQLLKNGATAGSLEFTSNVVIDSTGLGIGISSPVAGLDVRSAVAIRPGSTNTWAPPTTSGVSIMTGVGNSGSVGVLSFHSDRNDRHSGIEVSRGASSEYIGLNLYTSNAGAPEDRVYVTPEGKVGIGKNPIEDLEVRGNIRATRFDGLSQGVLLSGDSAANRVTGISLVGNPKPLILETDAESAGIRLVANGSYPIEFFVNAAERVRITSTGAFFPVVGTTASAANAFLSSGSSPANQLLRSTSSLRYKTDIEDIEQSRSEAILDFRPVWYRSTADADRPEWSWYGLIAEEVAEIEPRLVHWTYLDDAYEEVEGERQLKPDAEMVPDGVQYDRLTVLMLDLVQRQQQQIESLEARIAALEAQS